MRRLLYLALVLVFLAITGLAFVRVTSSGAYVARSRLASLNEGMPRVRVLELMDGLRSKGFTDDGLREFWDVEGGYALYVSYDEHDRVEYAFVTGADTYTVMDRLLDSLEYSRTTGHLPSHTFRF